jgi:hypothetical protein
MIEAVNWVTAILAAKASESTPPSFIDIVRAALPLNVVPELSCKVALSTVKAFVVVPIFPVFVVILEDKLALVASFAVTLVLKEALVASLAVIRVLNEALAAVNDPEILVFVNPLTVAISASSESIKAPADVTLEVLAVNLASFAVTRVLNEALAAVNEPLILDAICAEDDNNVLAVIVSLAVTRVLNDALAAVNEPDILTFVSPLTVAISESSESIKAPAEVTLEVLAVNLASFAVTLVLNEELAAVNEPLIFEDIWAEEDITPSALILVLTAASV